MPATSAISIPHDEDARRWARAALGVPEGTPAEVARGSALARLEEMEFVPPAQWEQAIIVLEEEPSTALWQRDLGNEMYRDREVALRKEVERFAKEFFSLPPAKRQIQWRELSARCGFSLLLTTWLEAMTPGLAVATPRILEGGRAQELADYVCQNFTKPVTARIAVDEVLLRHAAYAPKPWQDAALRLRKEHPQIAALAPHLVEHLSAYSNYCKREKKAEKLRQRATSKSFWTFPQLSGSRNYFWLIWVAVIVLGNVFRAGLFDSKPPKSFNQGASRNGWQSNFPRNSSQPPGPVVIRLDPSASLPDPSKKVEVGEAFRRMCGIPLDADVYMEDGKFIYHDKLQGTSNTGILPEQTPSPASRDSSSSAARP